MTPLVGCDFSSTPTRRKAIVMALGHQAGGRVVLERIEKIESLAGFAQWLAQPRDWVGGFDFPFGLPRELVEQLGWPLAWRACIDHYAGLTRSDIAKFAHRAFDKRAGSSPSMKWVNPPVAYMLHAALPLLLQAGVHLPGLHDGDPQRVALEAYPGMLARELIGRRSYKSDEKAKQTDERLIARKDLVTALEIGRTRLGLRLKLTHAQRDALVHDASGDSLDAVLCMVQAAWAEPHGPPRYGLPAGIDPLEGWIVSA